MGVFEFLGFFFYILIILSPLILLFAFWHIRYDFEEKFIRTVVLGITIRKLNYDNIESFREFEQFPFLKGNKFEHLFFNKSIMINLKKKENFLKAYVLVPKNRAEFVAILEERLQ
ncbi:MAG: hypothetical protein GY817_01910 [bacterium]|nr:hypothetical protein [bacterium]